jgi:hypothetical protein
VRSGVARRRIFNACDCHLEQRQQLFEFGAFISVQNMTKFGRIERTSHVAIVRRTLDIRACVARRDQQK